MADVDGCEPDYCVDDIEILPGSEDQVSTPVRGGSSAPRCTWSRRPAREPGSDGPGAVPEPEGERHPDSYLVFEICDGRNSGRIRWASPADPAAPQAPSPDALAQLIYVRLEGTLPVPVLSTDPPVGEPAIVDTPTFVRVENWTGTVTDQECFLLLCVTVTAEPSLSFTPGEPGAGSLACAGPGSRFDPAGPPSVVQASNPEACVHSYRLRTGAAGRPASWPGAVTVTWRLVWSSTSGRSGTLPDVTKSAELARAVNEVQTVVER